MTDQKTILVVDDEEFIRLNLQKIFTDEGYKVILKSNGNDTINLIKNEKVDLALLDINLPDKNGIEVLRELKEVQPDLLVIMITGFASVESAVNAIKLGAYDYIKKPFKADAIKLITKLALETQSLKKTVKKLKEASKKPRIIDNILGVSSSIKHVKKQIEEFAKYDSETVLIIGESGAGKELVASSLHYLSPRSEKEFVEINCAAIPETLLESELFGYEKGAFTDARKSKMGLLEKADKGTLFLDEIGDMSLALQAKLLRLLENKKFRRLGSTDDLEVDIRIIAATNKNLQQAIEKNEFRKDLYYRLNVLRIDVPPLRERHGDILILSEYFIGYFNKKFNKTINKISDEVKELFLTYGWPGNVRELKNLLERTIILMTDDVIKLKDLPKEFLETNFNSLSEPLLENENMNLGKYSFHEMMTSIEKNILNKAFTLSGKNTSKTARLLKIPRETLRDKLVRYNLITGEK